MTRTRLLTVQQTAAILGIKHKSVYALKSLGYLSPDKAVRGETGRIMFKYRDVMNYKRSRKGGSDRKPSTGKNRSFDVGRKNNEE